MAAHHVAVIGGVDDDGVVPETTLLQRVQDRAHVGVHQAAQPPIVGHDSTPILLRFQRQSVVAPFIVSPLEETHFQGLCFGRQGVEALG